MGDGCIISEAINRLRKPNGPGYNSVCAFNEAFVWLRFVGALRKSAAVISDTVLRRRFLSKARPLKYDQMPLLSTIALDDCYLLA